MFRLSIIMAGIVIVLNLPHLAAFDQQDYHAGIDLWAPVEEADVVVIGKIDFVTSVGGNLVWLMKDARILHRWDNKDANKVSSSRTIATQPASDLSHERKEIAILAEIERTPYTRPDVGPENHVKILFGKIVTVTPDQLRKYELKSPDLVIRPCPGAYSAIDIDVNAECLTSSVLKKVYKITKSDEVLEAVENLCKWRDLKDKKAQLEYLVKLLNENAKNKFYLDNVPKMIEHLGGKLKETSGRYVLESEGNKNSGK